MKYKNKEFGCSFWSFVNSTLLSMAELKHRLAQTAVDACEKSLQVAGETRASLNDVEERNKNVEERCLKNK